MIRLTERGDAAGVVTGEITIGSSIVPCPSESFTALLAACPINPGSRKSSIGPKGAARAVSLAQVRIALVL